MNLFQELKRRNVFKVAVAYIIVSWLILQVIGSIVPIIEAPEWVSKAILVFLIAGFPIALLFAWAFELTPEGIKKESEVDRDESITDQTSSKINLIIIGSLVLIIGGFVYDKFFGSSITEEQEQKKGIASEATAKENPIKRLSESNRLNDKSIAVLPFIPLSAEESDAYFGKGIAEELLNTLAKFPELKVAARTSAFSLSDKDLDLREIGAKLGVAHVLEGSVRSAGDKVRVTAQLIRASDGFHLWSETYDRNMADIFKVQDEIVSEINRTLQIRLGVGVGEGRAAAKQVDPVAYQNYLRGLELWGMREEVKSRKGAIRAFQLATSQDPDFADGWAAYGISLAHSFRNMSGMTKEQHRATLKQALDTAIALDAKNVRALAGLGLYYMFQELDVGRATTYLKSAIELAPNSAEARYAMAGRSVLTGDLSEIRQTFEQALALDPLNQTIKRVYIEALGALGDYEDVLEFIENCNGCTKVDQILGLSTLYMVARRNGTEKQVREAAAKYNQQLNKNGGVLKPYYSKTYVARQLVISSPVFVERLLGGAAVPEQQLNVLRALAMEEAPFDEPLVLAKIGETDLALSMLDLAYKNNLSNLSLITQPMGLDVWPDAVRRDPRFHAFWQKPGMPELAAMLRAKGMTKGLPLPLSMEGDE